MLFSIAPCPSQVLKTRHLLIQQKCFQEWHSKQKRVR